MLGAGAEGDFGVNAGIVYAHGSFALGFDLVLEHFGENAKCQGGKKMGYHGWYGMGQAYAMLTGDIGVMIRLWFIKKDVSLISVGLGAMLQAGLPNPTWAYGRYVPAAHCLVAFSSLTMPLSLKPVTSVCPITVIRSTT